MMKFFNILIFISIVHFSCEQEKIPTNLEFEQKVFYNIFPKLVDLTYYDLRLIPPPPPPSDYLEEKGYDVKKDYKKAYDDWKKSDDYLQRYKAWERERDSIVNDNALIYIAFSDSIAGFDKEDMFELLNHFKNEKLIIDSKNLDFNTGFKVDFNKLKSNNKKLRFKPVSSFPEGSEIWNDKYDLAGVLSFSRILFDKTKSYGVLNAGFMKGRLNGGGLRIFIKKDKKGTWIIDEIKETWIS
ncbi:hypothetical protein JoomaDRAFT_1591 [Galbibacter orientalis DSM 19592]|uniref:Uncharacterized protein n=1 Tax=Galbibacter orientalis DSM 19592 TaxID=926559 RepID=I3C4R0_9FLAO|nr:hypothetical protein [Galbibacter orientalis]EIJ38603.1 hypothetical protein JoomaDRAFT_1591 [Galbibacter orientalis DSM 19592]